MVVKETNCNLSLTPNLFFGSFLFSPQMVTLFRRRSTGLFHSLKLFDPTTLQSREPEWNNMDFSLWLVAGGKKMWINVSTVNTPLSKAGSSNVNTGKLFTVALANKFVLYAASRPWAHFGGKWGGGSPCRKPAVLLVYIVYETFASATQGVMLKTFCFYCHFSKGRAKGICGFGEKNEKGDKAHRWSSFAEFILSCPDLAACMKPL